jgi:hypothetical protein
MAEEILSLDEVKRIAKEFVRGQWNAEITDIKSILLSSDHSLHEVNGKLKIPQRVATGEPKCLPNNAPFYDTDVVYMECLFKLQVSNNNGKVVGYGKNREEAPPASPQYEQIFQEPVEFLPSEDSFGNIIDRETERRRKEAETENNKADAELKREKAKDIRERRHKDKDDSLKGLAKKYGIDTRKFKL